jgi:hypothetical protein
MAEKRTIELEVKTNSSKVATDLKDVAASAKGATIAAKDLGNASEEAAGKASLFSTVKTAVTGLVPGLKSAEGGVTSLGASFKALLANPIVLLIAGIVAALKFIYEAFQSNVKIGKEIAAVWEGLNAVGTQVKDAIFGLVRAFGYAAQAAYKFITLDFKGAAASMKKANGEAAESFDQLKKSVDGTTFSIVRNLEKQQQANNKAKKEQVVRQSEINKLLVQSREILTDETESLKNKKKALEDVTKAEKESSKEKVRTAAVDLKILETKAKTLGGQAEVKMKQEIRDATVALNEAETENAMTGIKLNKQRKMLNRQEKEETKAATDAKIAAGKEASAAAKERLKEEISRLETIAKDETKSFADRRKAVTDNLKIGKADKDKLIASINAEELKSVEAHNKAVADLTKRYVTAEEDRLANTATKKLELDKSRATAEILALAKTEEEKTALLLLLENSYLSKLQVIKDDKAKADKLKLDELTLSEQEKLAQKYAQEQLLYEGNEAVLLALKDKYTKDSQAITDAANAKQLASEQALADAKKAVQNAQLDNIIAGIGVLKGVFQENKKIQKGLLIAENAAGIAKILINTAASNAKAIAASPLTAGMPWVGINSVSAGIGIASSVAATAKGLAALGGGGSTGGGGNMPTAPSGGGGVTAPNFNIVGNSGINQLAELGGQPIQAYVVSGEVTSAQALDRNRIQNASF